MPAGSSGLRGSDWRLMLLLRWMPHVDGSLGVAGLLWMQPMLLSDKAECRLCEGKRRNNICGAPARLSGEVSTCCLVCW